MATHPPILPPSSCAREPQRRTSHSERLRSACPKNPNLFHSNDHLGANAKGGTATAPHNIPLKRRIPSRISSFFIRE